MYFPRTNNIYLQHILQMGGPALKVDNGFRAGFVLFTDFTFEEPPTNRDSMRTAVSPSMLVGYPLMRALYLELDCQLRVFLGQSWWIGGRDDRSEIRPTNRLFE